MQTDLLKLLPQFDVISFDVFDTLLVRDVLNPKVNVCFCDGYQVR